MDYRATVAEIRSTRDRQIAEAVAEANRQLAEVLAARDAEIRRLGSQGLMCTEIAAAVGCSRTAVRNILDPRCRLTASEAARLRERRNCEIRRLHAEDPDLPQAAIAKAVGCGKDTVYEVLSPARHEACNARRRERWRVLHGSRAA